MSAPHNVIPLTRERRWEHYWRRLVYLGPTQKAQCRCGLTRRHWWVRRMQSTDGYRVTTYRCRCGRPVVKIDATERSVT